MRDQSPRVIALRLALIIGLLVSGLVVGAVLLVGQIEYWWVSLLLGVVTFVVSYMLVYAAISRFIYEKVRIIYKNIHHQKRKAAGQLKLDMKEDVLAGVEQEVLEWAQDRTDEIARLREQEAFRREFIGNLAHELKTPVFSIQGYILTLLEGGLNDPSINMTFLKRAAKGVDRMTNMIEDLDTITRFESGRMELDLRKIDIVELAREVMLQLEMKAQEKGVAVRFDRKYEKPILVTADENRISQVLTNLLANALNYSSSEDGYAEVRFFDVDQHIMIEVSDNGIGIEQVHLSRLFERFYRVDKSRSRHEGGTGLGLAIVKHIVESHNQTINVRSSEGVGSTFSFTLEKAQ